MKTFFKAVLIVPVILALATVAQAKGRLTVYCSMQDAWCQATVKAFGEKYDVKTAMTHSGSGSTFAKIHAESKNPKADVWIGGTADPHLQAGEIGLLESYVSPNMAELGERFQNLAIKGDNTTDGIYAGVVGYSVNTKMAKEMGIAVPSSWKDLTAPKYKGNIRMASPQSSGTAYTVLATIVQLWGEEEGFKYLAKLHPNIDQYTKSGSAGQKAAARGEVLIGIGFLHDASKLVKSGFPLKLVTPSEGTGFEIGGLSIIKGARNLENAKKFVDWALSAEGQNIAAPVGAFQVPTNKNAKVPKEAFDLSKVNLIDYDFKTYGSNEKRKYLIGRWEKEIKPLAR